MTVERDLSRLRFLNVRIQKGENNITSEDIDFMQKQLTYLLDVVVSIRESLLLLVEREKKL